MSTLAENSGHVGDYPLAIAFLALLTLADNTLANTLPIVLGPVPPQVPGYWNLTTAALVVSVVSGAIDLGRQREIRSKTNESRLDRSTGSHPSDRPLRLWARYED